MRHTLLNIFGIVAVVFAVMFAIQIKGGKKMNTGINVNNLDFSVNPANDFFDFVTLRWRNAHPIPDDYVRYGVFEVLQETNLQRVREIAENDDGKIGLLYKIAMDDKRLNADKTTPVKKYFDEIDNIKSKSELPKYLGKNHTYFSGFWGDAVAIDEGDSEHFIYSLHQSGIGLPRDYYFDNDARTVEIRKKYVDFIAKQLKNFGVNADAKKIYELEERMAKSFFTKEKFLTVIE